MSQTCHFLYRLVFVLSPTYSRIWISIHNEDSVIIVCQAPRVLYYVLLLAVIAALTVADDVSSEAKCYLQLRPLANAHVFCFSAPVIKVA